MAKYAINPIMRVAMAPLILNKYMPNVKPVSWKAPQIKAVLRRLLPCPCAPKKRLNMSPNPFNVDATAKKEA